MTNYCSETEFPCNSLRSLSAILCTLRKFGELLSQCLRWPLREEIEVGCTQQQEVFQFRCARQHHVQVQPPVIIFFLATLPPSCRPQSMMTPSRIVLPWQAVEVMTRACEIGKPVLLTVYSQKTNGSAVRGSMKTKFRVSADSKVLSLSCKSFVNGAPAYSVSYTHLTLPTKRIV